MKIVRHKLVVALKVFVGDIEEERGVARLNTLLQHADRALVSLQQRREQGSYKWRFDYFGQRLGGEQTYQFWNQFPILGRLNDHGELHRGFLHLYCSLCIGIKCTIDNVGPVNQLCYRIRVEAKAVLGNGGNKTCARFEVRIVKLAA